VCWLASRRSSVSKPEAKDQSADRAALRRLESAVGEALGVLADARRRARVAEEHNAELEEVVHRFTADEGEANLVLSRLRGLEEENADMKVRLARGREGVERLLARVKFLEGQR
jgi:predicted nuclease with TOPRIM domain